MSNFKVGDRVVCVKKVNWSGWFCTEADIGYGPKEKEIVTVSGYSPTGSGYLYFDEYPELASDGTKNYYDPKFFRKLESDSISTEASRSLVKTLTVERLGTRKDKYLEEERELIINDNF